MTQVGGNVKGPSLDTMSKEAWDYGISSYLKVAFIVTRAERPGRPEDSKAASYMTGQLIVIDGGDAVQKYKVVKQ